MRMQLQIAGVHHKMQRTDIDARLPMGCVDEIPRRFRGFLIFTPNAAISNLVMSSQLEEREMVLLVISSLYRRCPPVPMFF